jgi:hypothetical protein
VIDCERQGRGFCFDSGETRTSVVEGLTITGGYAMEGGGVFIGWYTPGPSLVRCVITGNEADSGGGLYCGLYSAPSFTRCTFSGNTAHLGGGVCCWLEVAAALCECTISGNAAVPEDVFDLDGDGNTSEPTPLDLDRQARFVEDPNGPNTGNGTPPIVDMGAYEFQVGQTWCLGDANCSGGEPDSQDIPYFVSALQGSAAWATYYLSQHPGRLPSCPYQVCDLNGGGGDFSDIGPFIAHLGQPCDPYRP